MPSNFNKCSDLVIEGISVLSCPFMTLKLFYDVHFPDNHAYPVKMLSEVYYECALRCIFCVMVLSYFSSLFLLLFCQ